MANEKAEKSASIFVRGSEYFHESVDELRKVSKPTKQETMQFALVSVFIIFFIAVSLMVLDFFFSRIMTVVLG